MVNKYFGKLVNGAVQYAPIPLNIDGLMCFTNDAEKHFNLGYKPIVHTLEPDPVEGFLWMSEWVEYEDRIVLEWHQEEIHIPEDDPTHIIDILTGEVE